MRPQGNPIAAVKGQVQQRREVGGNGLGDKPQITSGQGAFVEAFHLDLPKKSCPAASTTAAMNDRA